MRILNENETEVSGDEKTTTHLIAVFVSPNSFLSVVCRNCMTACCFDADGWEMGMSDTWGFLLVM
jgi:hypothetical protein